MTEYPRSADAIPDPGPGEQARVQPRAGHEPLAQKVAHAWDEFELRLADVLADRAPGDRLAVMLDATREGLPTGLGDFYVRLTWGGDGTVAASAVGNANLPPAERFDRNGLAALAALGWLPPAVPAPPPPEPDSTPRPGGTSAAEALAPDVEAVDGTAPVDHHAADFRATGAAADVVDWATVVTRTLRDVFGAPHPAFLRYHARGETGPLHLDALGLPESAEPAAEAVPAWVRDSVSVAENGQAQLPARVLATVALSLGTPPESVVVDDDGDIPVRTGTAIVFVRPLADPPLVSVSSPILVEVTASTRLVTRLNELNAQLQLLRLHHSDDTVWARAELIGDPFQPAHLGILLTSVSRLADDLDESLQQEFGGRVFFGQATAATETAEGSGGYI